MRDLLRALPLALAAILAAGQPAAAPRAQEGTAARPAPAAQPARGTLVYGAGLPLRLDNPNLRGNGWNEAASLLYSRLYRVGLDGRIEPDLVERHEVSPDGLTWTLHLRRGAVWHDGRPVGSADVRSTLEQILDPNGGSDLRLNLPMVASFEYPAGDRVVVRLRRPAPLLPVPLSEIAILPARAGSKEGRPPGSGPFRFVREHPDGALELARHEGHHLGTPSIERILLREIPDDASRARELAAGKLDVAHVKPQHAEMAAGGGVRIVRMSTGAWRALPLNLRRPVLQDKRVRQAIDLALDREEIVKEALPGGGRPAYQHLPPESWAFAPELDRPYRDTARAAALLDQAGWRLAASGERRREGAGRAGPLTLRLIVWKDETFRHQAAEAIRRQLGALGVRVELALVDNAEYGRLAEAMGDRYDGFIGGWGALLDPGDNLYKKFHSQGSQNHIGLGDPELDRMLEEARAISDQEAARLLYRRILERLREEAVFLPLGYPDYLFGVRSRVGGVEPAVVDSWYEFPRNAHRWTLAP